MDFRLQLLIGITFPASHMGHIQSGPSAKKVFPSRLNFGKMTMAIAMEPQNGNL